MDESGRWERGGNWHWHWRSGNGGLGTWLGENRNADDMRSIPKEIRFPCTGRGFDVILVIYFLEALSGPVSKSYCMLTGLNLALSTLPPPLPYLTLGLQRLQPE